MKVVYIVQCLDDGTFLCRRNGEVIFNISLSDAFQFERLDLAIHNALDIDDSFIRVTVHPLYVP